MSEIVRQAVGFGPATVGNAGVGFDILGFAVDAVGDRVTVRRGEPGVRIEDIRGVVTELPRDAEKNTASVALLSLLGELNLDFGFDLVIEKGIPLGSGMGGSAASAVAAVVAANALLDAPLPTKRLFPHALAGEAVASGAAHPDNVAPCLFGGLTLVAGESDVVDVPVPEGLLCVLVHPDVRVDTREARAVVPREIPLDVVVRQSAFLASFLAGCYTSDIARIGAACRDLLVEPYRSGLIPGFDSAREAAHAAGALAFSISGSGPTVFALADSHDAAQAVRAAICDAFARQGRHAEGWVSPIEPRGAYVVERQ